jgi:hypothetical protein
VGPVRIPQKVCQDTLCQTCVFASAGICESRSEFRCIWGMKHQHTVFHARVGRVHFAEKARLDTLCETCDFASGWIYRSHSATRARNAKHHFSCSGGTGTNSTKKHVGALYAKLVFLHPVGSVGHVVHSGVYRARNVEALFFLLRWDQNGFHKKAHRDTLHRTCDFASGGICGSRSAFRCT